MFRFTDLIIFELTRDCNLDCKYCYVRDKHLYRGEVMDFDLYKKVIDTIVKQRLIEHVKDRRLCLNFHGGEFTLVGKDRFRSYAEYAIKTFCENGIRFELGCQTNGINLDDEWIAMLRHYGINVGLSFDSFYEEPPLRFTHEQRERVINNLRKLVKANLTNGVLSVISKNNIDLTDEDSSFEVEDSRGEKVSIHRKTNFVEDTINPFHSKYELTGKEIFEKLFKKYIDRFLETGELIEEHTKDIISSTIIDIVTEHNPPYSGGCNGKFCGAGLTMIATRPDGTAMYCDRYKKDYPEAFIMNLLDYDFLGIHQLKKAFEFTLQRDNSVRKVGCDRCKAESVCEYGCSAMYYSKFGEYGVQENLVCDQFKMSYDYVEANIEKLLKKFIECDKIRVKAHVDKTIEARFLACNELSSRLYIRNISERGRQLEEKLGLRFQYSGSSLKIFEKDQN